MIKNFLFFLISMILISCNQNSELILMENIKYNDSFKDYCLLSQIENIDINQDSNFNSEFVLNFSDIEEIVKGYPISKDNLIQKLNDYDKNSTNFKLNNSTNPYVFEKIDLNLGEFLQLFKPIVIDDNFYIIPFIRYSKHQNYHCAFVKRENEETIIFYNLF